MSHEHDPVGPEGPEPAPQGVHSVDSEVEHRPDDPDLPFVATIADEPGAGGPVERVAGAQPVVPRLVVKRRVWLPVILFVSTCLSTFFVGVTQWSPTTTIWECSPLPGIITADGGEPRFTEWTLMPLRQAMISNWHDGLIYMVLVMAILLAHELGHFVATLIYRVPASYPIFLPFPLNPLGTLGAVIGMQGALADRRQIFDIGIAGPIAGLVIAVPVMFIGVAQLDLTGYPAGAVACQCPVGVQWMMEQTQPEGYVDQTHVWVSQLNPFFAAGWVGFLITGINMMPVSQLDGGHVTYTLFGKPAHWIARGTLSCAIAFMIFTAAPTMVLMVILLLLVGTDHPPTRDDRVPLGFVRYSLGLLSLAIPILCFPPLIFHW